MINIPKKFIEAGKLVQGYKDEFYYVDKVTVVKEDPIEITGEIQFKPPAYLRINQKDVVFNNTEAALAGNQISHLVIALTEEITCFTENQDINKLKALYAYCDPRSVVRKQEFTFNKPITTAKDYCPFTAKVIKAKKIKNNKFFKIEIVLGEEKNFTLTITAVMLNEPTHNADYY